MRRRTESVLAHARKCFMCIQFFSASSWAHIAQQAIHFSGCPPVQSSPVPGTSHLSSLVDGVRRLLAKLISPASAPASPPLSTLSSRTLPSLGLDEWGTLGSWATRYFLCWTQRKVLRTTEIPRPAPSNERTDGQERPTTYQSPSVTPGPVKASKPTGRPSRAWLLHPGVVSPRPTGKRAASKP